MAWQKIKRVSKDRELWVLHKINPRTKKNYEKELNYTTYNYH